ncbi:MAG TPA: alpha-galactosidase [Abditibacteriaceae bacterium]|jgi:alpha-galactosidase
MNIHYDETHRTFHLQTPGSSYILQVTESGYVAHIYWGARLRALDPALLLESERDRSFSPHSDPSTPGFSLDTLPQEFPTYGTSDFRTPALEVRLSDGSSLLDLRYRTHRILPGKAALPGLPALYVEDEGEADTLELELFDARSGLLATLSYSVFAAANALTRSVRLRNEGSEPIEVLRCLSASVDFSHSEFEMLHLSGAWARERDEYRARLRPGAQSIESRRGAGGHEHNPFFALLSPGASEERGEVYAFNFVYSGNFVGGAEVAQYSTTRAQIGLNPIDFCWQLEAGEEFQAPEAVLVYSPCGLGEMSRTFHRLYRTRLCRGKWRDRERPVLINSWEANYFNISQEKMEALGRTASEAGIELLVMDDGWFGHRDDDTTSLGDWFVHRDKFPHGLEPLVSRINAMGLGFGLWFEPEMVSPDSELYRAHPDWCLHVPHRRRTTSRNQLILDLSRAEVCDFIVDSVSKILSSAPITYVKWDMNRNMTEVGSGALPPQRQRETAHRYMLGLYRVLETLTQKFPDVLFESCSGGGGRFDPGMLFYMPQTWTSDNTDAISRLRIQHGTSLVYPPISMGAHVSASPNHQVGRSTPLSTRGVVSMGGNFGYELDLNRLSEEDRTQIRQQVAFYKTVRPLVQFGELYRLHSPFEANQTAWMMVSDDRKEALVFFVQVLSEANAPFSRLKLAGLDADADYMVREVFWAAPHARAGKKPRPTEARMGGDVLCHAGLHLPNRGGDFFSRMWHLRAVNTE